MPLTTALTDMLALWLAVTVVIVVLAVIADYLIP